MKKRPRILVVEDEVISRRNMADILNRRGYIVNLASSGKSARVPGPR